jgi:hypothetical protein
VQHAPQHEQQQQQEDGPDSPPPSPSHPTPGSLDVREITLLLARFACNNHTICDEELRAIGVGLYPLGALVNHSCRPNCMQTFSGRNIVFRWAVLSGWHQCRGWQRYRVQNHTAFWLLALRLQPLVLRLKT